MLAAAAASTRRSLSTSASALSAATGAKPAVGFIGLGNMGKHMARNLLRAGYPVIVNDVNEAPVRDLASEGARPAATPRAVAEQARNIVTMLPSNPHVKGVYYNAGGIFEALQKDSLLIDASTIDPSISRAIAKDVVAKNLASAFIDAPVSGGVGGAEKGTLTFMVGGEKSAFDRAQPLLQAMGKNIVYCGAAGNGQVAKLCNNLLLAISMAGTSEVMNLGVTMGLDPKLLAGIINTSSGRCWSSEVYNPFPGVIEGVPSSRDYNGGFGSKLMLKDVNLALDAAKGANAPTPMGSRAKEIYDTVTADAQLSEKDFSVVLRYLQQLTRRS
ncbi:3-hydroxyisobutyrate dehydrogenase [Capsaspora owczarzaki ATCC 30864]|uniref:3-hydroxyisobutyrate dehydrogenase n=1 Tax=Capsaspora owczarzaki (strain ATCC 30864) TaxID=595528 RepID=A0A0D2X3Z0_CAPO3|nr:3-hydroxyisobutyrate dehydrogenase [Capsaspora owczarzaki ATCC 30864]KJE95144.1 3-hydroxyisobutyrate dehydrogenase [Capsaspora owczarzaki ATCC 30864]|eukprot:XP_004346300.1 3-hydroxyisobutyrate dehydrogenase [Capsaspora owczarzaki ATCC 30864]